jgi:hypothetical protein
MDIKCLYKYERSVYIPFILNLSGEYSFKKLEKGGQSVNYFVNLGAKCHFSKIGCCECSFSKRKGCQYNLPYNLIRFIFLHNLKKLLIRRYIYIYK